MDKKYKEEKRVFEKHKQKLYKNEKEIYSIFLRYEFGKKKPAGRRTAKKKNEKNKQGPYEKGSCKKTWSWMVSLYRPWQDPIGQGHGEWNGNRPLLYPSLSAMPRAHPSWPK